MISIISLARAQISSCQLPPERLPKIVSITNLLENLKTETQEQHGVDQRDLHSMPPPQDTTLLGDDPLPHPRTMTVTMIGPPHPPDHINRLPENRPPLVSLIFPLLVALGRG